MKLIRSIVAVAMVMAIWSTVNVQAENSVTIGLPEMGRTYNANENVPVDFKAACPIEKPSKITFSVQKEDAGPFDSSTVWFHQNLHIRYDVRLSDTGRYRLQVKAICGGQDEAYGEVHFKIRR